VNARHSDTDWIKPGAPIAYYQVSHGGDRYLRTTTVNKVAKQSFTVTGFGDRFKLDSMRTKQTGSYGAHYCAVHPDSEEAARVAANDERERLKTAVWPLLYRDCIELDKVDAAIQALREWRAVLVSEVSR